MEGPLKAYKGMTWHCTSEFGNKFRKGETYLCEKAQLRKSGFHACLNPWHILDYYTPYNSRFFEVEMNGIIESCDHMLTATQMTVLQELTERNIIALLVEHRDFRLESCQTVLSEKKADTIYGKHTGLVVHSKGKDVDISADSDYAYILSEGDDANIIINKWCCNNLVLCYGNRTYLDCGGSSRIETYGKDSEITLTGSNHALKLAEGTKIYYNDKEWVAGIDFEADTYYTTDGKSLSYLGQKVPMVEKVLIE